ncbi:MAG: DNA-directed RNA polymerase subunit alpha [Candidatus Wildermuthbacteria bacterium]|nr:DNA-directed RNA polymerase subunit alpha [Candidatus Wildermuthbacteria bacterium]
MIPLSNAPKVLEKKGNKAVFELEALYPGYGVTVGNSLRRVLFSSLGGAAATQANIKGVTHEFSTIPGVMEDVVTLLLNLKLLRFKMYADEPQKATLKVKGEKEVTGGDFELPSQLELVNEDVHIATLTQKGAELEIEIQVEKGTGYMRSEDMKKGKQDIGMVYLDAIFTPIKNVSFRVEHVRVGERTDFDKLTMVVETDGTMSPEQALYESAEVLRRQFEVISTGVKPAEKPAESKPEKSSVKKEKKPKKEGKKKTKKAK